VLLGLSDFSLDKEVATMPRKRRLSLVLTRRAYIPDYSSHELIATLSKEFNLTLVVRGRVIREDVLANLPPTVRVLEFDDEFPDKFSFLADLFTRRYWRRSSSFKVRLLREESWESRGEFLKRLRSRFPFSSLSRILRGRVNRRLLLQSSALIFPISSTWHKLIVPRARSLERAIREADPQLVMVPSNAYGYLDVEAVRVATKLGAKSLLCVDNWDNMSSKAVLIRKPTAIAVVGPQSAQHAIRIHRFPAERVFPIGAPRFYSYSRNRIPHKAPLEDPYVFVAGYSQPFDEIELVRFVSQLLTTVEAVTRRSLWVVYRPHPWKQRDLSGLEELENVIIDDPFQGNAYLDLAGVSAWMFHARAVVGAPTTLLLEALLMQKEVAIAAIEDPHVLVGPQIEFDQYTHFQELTQVQGVTVCRDFGALEDYIRSALESEAVEKERKPLTVDFLITRDSRGYASSLVDCLNKL